MPVHITAMKKNVKKLLKNKKTRPLGIILIIIALLFALYSYYETGSFVPTSELFDGKPTIRFVDVGQGDCTLVTYRGDAVLVDAGGAANGPVTAEYVSLYSPSVDYFVITHPHEDHMGGAPDILERIDVDTLIMSDVEVSTEFYKKTIQIAKEKGVQIIELDEGAKFATDYITIEILDAFDLIWEDLNNASLVTRIDVADTSILVTGDAEKEEEKFLLRTSRNLLDVDILKVGHHGSNSSSSDDFLEAVSPDYCVISCGENNSYGHPASDVLNRLKKTGAEILRTDRIGHVVLRGSESEE